MHARKYRRGIWRSNLKRNPGYCQEDSEIRSTTDQTRVTTDQKRRLGGSIMAGVIRFRDDSKLR